MSKRAGIILLAVRGEDDGGDRATDPPWDDLAQRWLGHQEHLALIEAADKGAFPTILSLLSSVTTGTDGLSDCGSL